MVHVLNDKGFIQNASQKKLVLTIEYTTIVTTSVNRQLKNWQKHNRQKAIYKNMGMYFARYFLKKLIKNIL